jgi:hypothetical protein
MADIDLLPARGIPRKALVDATGIATNGTQTVAQLAARGMEAVCAVDGSGNAVTGSGTLLQLAQRGIRAFCPVDETGVATDSSTADQLRMRGIRPMVLLNNTGIALTGSATMLTLAQRGLGYFCPVDESGNATTMGAVVILSNTTVFDNATIGSTVGALSVSGGTGTYTYSFLSNPGTLFAISGSNLNTAAALTAGNKPIQIRASGGVPTPVDRVFTVTVVPSPTLPANTFAPVISGTPADGSTLTVTNNGTWTGTPAPSFSYQWKSGATNVGSNSINYTATTADVGNNITCVVTGTNSAGNASAVSNALGPVTGSGGTLDTPSIALVSPANDNRPDFDIGIPVSSLVSDVFRLQANDGSGYVDYIVHSLTSGDLSSGAITIPGVTPLADGSYTYRARMERVAAFSSYSTTVSGNIDTTAPTITTPSAINNNEGSLLAITLTANETVTWTLTGGVDLARFEISGTTLQWAGNGVKSWATPNDADANNTYIVQVTATDTATNVSNKTITVTVLQVSAGVRCFGAEGVGIIATAIGTRSWGAEGVGIKES